MLSPQQRTKILSGFLRAMLDPFGEPSLAILEATALLLGAKLGDLEGKLGNREVMLKLSWAMLYHAEGILFSHAVGFASRHERYTFEAPTPPALKARQNQILHGSKGKA